MTTRRHLPSGERRALILRLKRIEGQARGIQRMIEEDRDCLDVITQIVAMRAATDAVAGQLLEDFALRCFHHPEEFGSPEQTVERAVHALVHGGR